MPDYESLFDDASRLPIGERIQLIEALWETVSVEALPSLSDEWIAEIQRRSAEYDGGLVHPTPWEQVRADALRRAGLSATDDAH